MVTSHMVTLLMEYKWGINGCNRSNYLLNIKSIKNSKSYVYLTQFEFDLNFVATFKSNDSNEFIPEYRMVKVLKDAGNRGVDVKIILNENLAVPDTYKEISQYFRGSNVEVREFKSAGLHVMHAKTMIVDGEQAFIIGSPFKQDYWDTNQHLIDDPRREPEHVRPVHDVSVKLEGGSVYHVEEFFTDIWNYTSDENYHGKGKLKPITRKPPLQVVRVNLSK